MAVVNGRLNGQFEKRLADLIVVRASPGEGSTTPEDDRDGVPQYLVKSWRFFDRLEMLFPSENPTSMINSLSSKMMASQRSAKVAG
ncbi:uncharacterized protein N7459_002162 [Penicillium hispanicum]|uniref:uncharacterized protein n=1 Tax=Penicillium hispanicum TaxID=1080232 RepID=UPI00253F86BE|nr:uncharacterized protein N7459_002162 [Penicillium hispanicum]KAJ5591793.1 hypothetical protein N7459_002162 [Penicillium hispanicum]